VTTLEDDAPAATTDEPEAEADPLDELKRRYAAGEIYDAEFERRLERLVAVDDFPDELVGDSTATEGSDEREYERERER